jgi:methionyl-tRNA formyltransferase
LTDQIQNLKKLKILFMGTPEFGAVVLRALATSQHQVVGVLTQPDRPVGRKNILTPPPVKVVAQEFNLPLLQVEKLRGAAAQEQLSSLANDADVFVVASFGMILPQVVLDMPRLQCLNVHGSLLPLYRGASPVAQAILDGVEASGVTIMLMERGLDTGPMLSKTEVPLTPDETQTSLMLKLAQVGADLLLETLPRWVAGTITPEPQDNAKASVTGIISKNAGHIDWTNSAAHIERMTRAYDPWPGVFTYWNGQNLKILKAEVFQSEQLYSLNPNLESTVVQNPGQVFLAQVEVGTNVKPQQRLVIATGSGWLAPLELQLPGKKALAVRDFLSGQSAIVGAILK